jgi:hypothetical protein
MPKRNKKNETEKQKETGVAGERSESCGLLAHLNRIRSGRVTQNPTFFTSLSNNKVPKTLIS